MRMIVLAAGQGTRLRPLTDDRPKCLVELAGRPLLAWQIEAARTAGIDEVVVIGGHREDQLASYGTILVSNPRYATTNMVRTLFCARHLFGDEFVMSYGDIVYTPEVLTKLLRSKEAISVIVDEQWRNYWEQRSEDPLSDAETLSIDDDLNIIDIGQKPNRIEEIDAQYIGLVAFRGKGVGALIDAYEACEASERDGLRPFGGPRDLDHLYMTDLLQGLIKRGERLAAVKISRGWVEIDSPADLALAEEIVHSGGLRPGR